MRFYNEKIPVYCKLKHENLCLFVFQDDECVRPGDASDLTFLEKLEEKMGNHPHFVT